MSLSSAGAALFLAACNPGTGLYSGKPTRNFAYEPPAAKAAGAVTLTTTANPAQAFNLVVRTLRDSGLIVDPKQVHAASGVIVATYAGAPAPFVDCGTMVARNSDIGGEPTRIPATAEEGRFIEKIDGNERVMTRGIRLDARIVVQVIPAGKGAEVSSDVNYVVTKSVGEGKLGTEVTQFQRETVVFASGETGRFQKGTVCQSTGILEAKAVERLPGAVLAPSRTSARLKAAGGGA